MDELNHTMKYKSITNTFFSFALLHPLNKLKDNEIITLGDITIKCILTPGHTQGHICFYCTSPSTDTTPFVFTGDTMFVGGCGRLFEGTAKDMKTSLTRLARLPGETRVYCGHEYTLNNFQFARSIAPGDEDIKGKEEWAIEQRKNGLFTIPSTIGSEILTNVFVRASLVGDSTFGVDNCEEIRKNVNCLTGDSEELVAAVRRGKDNFKG